MDRGPIECPNLRFFSLLSSFEHPILGFYYLVCRDFVRHRESSRYRIVDISSVTC